MNITTYTPQQIIRFMASMKEMYSIVRLVDPEECRELYIDEKGTTHFGDKCYRAWNAGQRCANCVSFRASHAQKTLSKTKVLGTNVFHIISTPVRIRTNESLIFCNLELGTVEPRGDEMAEIDSIDDFNDTEYLLTHDILTRLYNIEGFYRAARQELIDYPDHRYVVLAGNIRRFNVLNTLFGRAYGDSVLISLSDMFRADKDPHALYARDYSEGFLLLKRKEDLSYEMIEKKLAEIRNKFSTSFFMFNLHVGIYEISEPNLPLSVMVDRAVLAMRSTRTSSERMIASFDDAMLQKELREQEIISTFDKYLHDGGFRMYLQPQVNRDGEIIGAEALVRVLKEDGTVSPPQAFISVLEKSEQIARLDQYIWEMAVQKLAEWEELPGFHHLYISVNVSPRDLYTIDVPQTLADICDSCQVDHSRLHVEITETSVLDDMREKAGNIERLQDLGFCVEIDDFGKGSSSLAMLNRSTANVLKIDREFLHEIQESERSFLILKAVIQLTKSIGMKAIIEGVENPEQLDILTSIGCDTFQGVYFAKPMPVEELEEKYSQQ